MKMKVKDLRRLIRENYAREIPQYAIEDACSDAIKMKPDNAARFCRDQLEHYFKMHINSTSSSPLDMRHKIAKMHQVFDEMEEDIRKSKNLKDDLREILDQCVRRFLFV